jgi:hypothetical protein
MALLASQSKFQPFFCSLSRTPIPPPASLSRKRIPAFSKADWMRIKVETIAQQQAFLVPDRASLWITTAAAAGAQLGWFLGPINFD